MEIFRHIRYATAERFEESVQTGFSEGALNVAGVPTEARCLDWRPEGSPFGACHCLELSLLFGSWERWQGAQMLGRTSRQEWEEKAQAFREEYITFIR